MDSKLIEILIRARDEASGTIARVGTEVGSLDDKTKGYINTAARGTGIIAGLGALGFGAISYFGLKAAGDMQVANTAMTVLTGSTATANDLFGKLAVFANNTPFEFKDVSKAATTLLGFGIANQDVFGDVKMLGDISAATGADLTHLALVFGQVNATGRLMGQDALQLINNNVPITTILAKNLGITMAEVQKRMQAGAISAEEVNAALKSVTQSGGFAFEGTAKLADTFNGRISTLKDSLTQAAERLVGVSVSAEGLKVDPNGLFAKASDGVLALSKGLAELPAWWDKNKQSVEVAGGAIIGVLTGIAALLVVINSEAILAAGAAVLAAAPFVIIGALAGGAAILVMQHWSQLVSFFTGLWASITGAAGAAWDWVRDHGIESLGFLIGFFATLPIKLPFYMLQAAVGMVNAVLSVNWGSVAGQIGGSFSNMWDGVKNMGLNVFNFFKNLDWGSILKSVGNGVIALIEGALNGALHGIPGAPKIHIPRFASGVSNFGGGLAVVGENGPELVNLPGGSSVYSNSQSQQIAAGSQGGGGDVHVHLHVENFLGEPGELRNFAGKVYQAIQQIDRSNGRPVLPNIGLRPA